MIALLLKLTIGLEKTGGNPFSNSFAAKQNITDEGPFAFLIKDAAIHAPGANHRYVEAPELVEDIAGCLLGNDKATIFL